MARWCSTRQWVGRGNFRGGTTLVDSAEIKFPRFLSGSSLSFRFRPKSIFNIPFLPQQIGQYTRAHSVYNLPLFAARIGLSRSLSTNVILLNGSRRFSSECRKPQPILSNLLACINNTQYLYTIYHSILCSGTSSYSRKIVRTIIIITFRPPPVARGGADCASTV